MNKEPQKYLRMYNFMLVFGVFCPTEDLAQNKLNFEVWFFTEILKKFAINTFTKYLLNNENNAKRSI